MREIERGGRRSDRGYCKYIGKQKYITKLIFGIDYQSKGSSNLKESFKNFMVLCKIFSFVDKSYFLSP